MFWQDSKKRALRANLKGVRTARSWLKIPRDSAAILSASLPNSEDTRPSETRHHFRPKNHKPAMIYNRGSRRQAYSSENINPRRLPFTALVVILHNGSLPGSLFLCHFPIPNSPNYYGPETLQSLKLFPVRFSLTTTRKGPKKSREISEIGGTLRR